jgi:aminoglycoside 6'-N-acetyltransferase I
MSGPWTVRAACLADEPGWVALRRALWPGEVLDDVRGYLDRPQSATAFVAVGEPGEVPGFAEATIRHDYVNGCETSPVGFPEGWYVVPRARGQGMGRALVHAVEHWALLRGCHEPGSDALLDNDCGHAAHRACGFRETERVVYFCKRLAA